MGFSLGNVCGFQHIFGREAFLVPFFVYARFIEDLQTEVLEIEISFC